MLHLMVRESCTACWTRTWFNNFVPEMSDIDSETEGGTCYLVARERCRPRVGLCAAQAMRTFTRIDACAAMCVRPSRIIASLV